MQNIKKAIIIGGGASGIATAYYLCRSLNVQDFVLLEANDRIGKKLSATGNGQCNLSNDSIAKENYYGNQQLIDTFLQNFDKEEFEQLFYKLGIPLTSEKGKIFPLSKQANAVLDGFRLFFSSHGTNIITNAKVQRIDFNNGIYVATTSEGKQFFAKNIIFAIGGKAGKQYGTDGSAYSLVNKFGHKTTNLYPSIVQLKTEKDKIKGLKGHKEVCKVTCIKDGKEIKSARGDVLFTEYGVSGNAIFSISSATAGEQNCLLKLEFLPDYDIQQIKQILIDKKQNAPYIESQDILSGIINKKIGEAVVKASRNPDSVDDICDTLKNFTLKVEGSMGFDYAQVTRGGLSCDKIDTTSLESKYMKGLYFIGEVLDVDGDCGGYNLTFAFTTAKIVAQQIIKKYS